MKNIRTFFLLLLSLTFVQAILSQDLDYQKIGDNVAATLVSVEPGEIVFITGGEYSLRMMEAIATGVLKMGGTPFLNITTDKIQNFLLTDVSEEHFLSFSDPSIKWLEDVDVLVMIMPYSEDQAKWNALMEGLSEVKKKKLEEVGMLQLQALMLGKMRVVIFTYPTEEQAKASGMDMETYTTEYLKGLTADFEKVRKTGMKLEEMLVQSKEVHITTPFGTDIRFQTTGRSCWFLDGSTTAADREKPFMERVESVPSGMIYQTIHEHSASGKLFIPASRCDDLPQVKNLSVTFTDGMMGELKGEGKDCIEAHFAPYEKEARLLGRLSIGLNTGLQIIEEGAVNFRPGLAAGMVYLYLGNNADTGGENSVEGAYYFPVTNATVTIDGVVVVKDGVLQD
ncbi:MAG: aminopeptidase [Lewinellaceae bacterium]|nr:aminopeptidase [Lewinellaceae bacterium]